MLNIKNVAKKLGLKSTDIMTYGNYMAKITKSEAKKDKGKLILVSAITPTTSGEGKTTVSIGLADALNYLGSKTVLALREPSLGPVFGIKGGACGGGRSEILPSDEINLHFTGDMHAITSANNLLCAMIDNSIFQGNELDIDPDRVVFKRAMDMNDRALRDIEISREKLRDQRPRKDGFNITAASEVMALMCLAKDFEDLKRRLGNILVAYTNKGEPVYARDIGAVEAMAILLNNAFYPNLVQTAYGNPAIVHLGPFANIAHGCNSVVATKLAISLGDYTVTEAGFGADLGAEKFLDVKCRLNGLNPNAIVLVATIKALKLHSSDGSVESGFCNLERHINNFKNVFNKKVVVAINIFKGDKKSEISKVTELCNNLGVTAVPCSPYTRGRVGCVDLAKEVIKLCDEKLQDLHFPYDLEDNLESKIEKLATKIYGTGEVSYSDVAKQKLKDIERASKGLPIVVAKTQYSFSDNPKLFGAPSGFTFSVTDIELKSGAEFVVVIAGSMALMPGLGKVPNAVKMYIDSDRNIHNLR